MKNEVWQQVAVRPIVEAMNRSGLLTAMARFLAGDLRGTIHECTECIFNPDTSREAEYAAFFLRGWSHYLSGDPQNGIYDLSIWLDREKQGDEGNVASGYKLRAACYESLGDWEHALDDLDAALDQIGETAPEAAEILYRRATIRSELQMLPAAISDYQKVIIADPTHDRAAEHLALLKRNAVEEAAALRATERPRSRRAPQVPVLTAQDALDKLAENDIESAIEICEDILENRPEAPDIHFAMGFSKDLRGRNFRKRGDTDAAEQDYLHAIESYSRLLTEEFHSPFSTLAFDRRGQLRLALGKGESLLGAIADFSTVIERENDNLLAYIHRGKAYMNLTDYKAAVADFNHVIELDATNSLARELNGTVAFLVDDTQNAKQLFEEARLHCDDSFGEVRIDLMRGAVAYLGNASETAIALLETVENRIKEIPPWELGEMQRKMQLLERKLFPESRPVIEVEAPETDRTDTFDAIWRRIREWISNLIPQGTPALVPA